MIVYRSITTYRELLAALREASEDQRCTQESDAPRPVLIGQILRRATEIVARLGHFLRLPL